MPTKKLKGPKSKWTPKKHSDADLKTLNAWAAELHRWAAIITSEARIAEGARPSSSNHIPDPPDPPFI